MICCPIDVTTLDLNDTGSSLSMPGPSKSICKNDFNVCGIDSSSLSLGFEKDPVNKWLMLRYSFPRIFAAFEGWRHHLMYCLSCQLQLC